MSPRVFSSNGTGPQSQQQQNRVTLERWSSLTFQGDYPGRDWLGTDFLYWLRQADVLLCVVCISGWTTLHEAHAHDHVGVLNGSCDFQTRAETNNVIS